MSFAFPFGTLLFGKFVTTLIRGYSVVLVEYTGVRHL